MYKGYLAFQAFANEIYIIDLTINKGIQLITNESKNYVDRLNNLC